MFGHYVKSDTAGRNFTYFRGGGAPLRQTS